MKKENPVPDTPRPQSISTIAEERLAKWIDYFKNLSPRIRMILPAEETFFTVQKLKTMATAMAQKDLNSEQLQSWPMTENIAFAIAYDSSHPGCPAKFEPKDIYIFCLKGTEGKAFGLSCFAQDDKNIDPSSHSLRWCPKNALRWKYAAAAIALLVRETEGSVSPIAPHS